MVYLDSTATTHKPKMVLNAIQHYLAHDNSNIHRGAYALAERSETLYYKSKEAVCRLIGAAKPEEIVYTHNSTYALNILVGSLVQSGKLKTGDTVLLSMAEHHANVVPWFIWAKSAGFRVEFVGLDANFRIDMADFARKYTPNVRVVSVTAVSNVTGAINPISAIKQSLREDTLLVVDASQAVPHMQVDVQKWGCDFAFFTAHKCMALTGVGVLYGKKELLKTLEPVVGGGGAINWVSEEGFAYAGLPDRFEPGTPNVVGAVSLLSAIEYLESIGGYTTIAEREDVLGKHMLEGIADIQTRHDIRLIGPQTTQGRAAVYSFAFEGAHPADVADYLGARDVCVRVGHHCAEPLAKSLGVGATLRASMYLYNDLADVDRFFATFDAALTHLGA